MLVSEITRRVQRVVGDDSFITFNQQDIYDWVNEGMLDLTRKTKCNQVIYSAAANAFAPTIVSTGGIEVTRVVYNRLPLTYITQEALDGMYVDPTYVSEPAYFYWDDVTGLKIFPIPSASNTNVISVTYNSLPTQVTAVGDTPVVPAHYHMALVSFCKMRFYERVQNYRAMESAASEYYGALSLQLEESSDRVDQYPCIGDDPWEVGMV